MKAYVLAVAAVPVMFDCSGGDERTPEVQTARSDFCCVQPPSVAWSHAFGAPSLEALDRIHVAADDRGNAIAASTFRGQISLPTGTHDAGAWWHAFVLSLDRSGEPRWTRWLGGDANVYVTGVAVDPDDNVVVTGTLNGASDLGGGPISSEGNALFLAKYDTDGDLVWSRLYAGDNTTLWAGPIASDRWGNLVWGVALEGLVDFGGLSIHHPVIRPAVIKLDRDATPLWERTFEGSVDQVLQDVDVDQSGNIAVGADSRRTILDGVTYSGGGLVNVLVVSFTGDGDVRWVKYVGDQRDQMVSSLSMRRTGDMVVSGWMEGNADFGNGVELQSDTGHSFVVAIDKHGRARWGRLLSAMYPAAVGIDRNGDVALAGGFGPTLELDGTTLESSGGSDIVVMALRAAHGRMRWGAAYGDALNQTANAVAVGKGFVVVAGYFDGVLTLGADSYASKSGRDLFVARLE